MEGSKVPLRITGIFWVTKLATTFFGEAVSDALVHRFSSVPAVLFGFFLFAACFALQFAVRRYVPWIYWLAVTAVAIFGTMAADVLHVGFHVAYVASSSFFAVCLVVVFVLWHRSQGTLSIHSITTPARELFYWATVITTFALGTALGDLSATTFGLGYFTSGLVFFAIFLIPALGYRFLHWNAVFSFWCAYIFTRPIGASFADFLGKPVADGGRGYPPSLIIGVTVLVIVALVALQERRSHLENRTRHHQDETKLEHS